MDAARQNELRSVTRRSFVADELQHANAAFQMSGDDDHVVLHLPVGSPGYARDGRRDGPRGSYLRPVNFEASFSPDPWTFLDMVMVYRLGDDWSTWRWRRDGVWTDGAYLNLEQPWTQTPIGWDTEDLTLDVVVQADGSVVYKDEDELAWATGMGVYTSRESEAIKETGRRAHAHAVAGGWPLDVDWDRWIPTSASTPELSPDWQRRR